MQKDHAPASPGGLSRFENFETLAGRIAKLLEFDGVVTSVRTAFRQAGGLVPAKSLIFGLWVREGSHQDLILLNRAYHQPVRVVLSSFHVTETNSILIGLSFGLGPSDVGCPLARHLLLRVGSGNIDQSEDFIAMMHD